MDKAALRHEMLEKRKAIAGLRRQEAEEAILQKLTGRPEWERARTVALYYPVRGEVGLMKLLGLKDGKRCLFPKVDGNELRFCRVVSEQELSPGAYGIPEPGLRCPEVSETELDLFLVPGVAYSETGYRLGYGGGYYDRVLSRKGIWQMAVGVAFSCQVVSELPVDSWDMKVDLVLTEEREIFPATAVYRRREREE